MLGDEFLQRSGDVLGIVKEEVGSIFSDGKIVFADKIAIGHPKNNLSAAIFLPCFGVPFGQQFFGVLADGDVDLLVRIVYVSNKKCFIITVVHKLECYCYKQFSVIDEVHPKQFSLIVITRGAADGEIVCTDGIVSIVPITAIIIGAVFQPVIPIKAGFFVLRIPKGEGQ